MILCASCERANAPRARFCAGCGAPLGARSGAAVTPPASAETRLIGQSPEIGSACIAGEKHEGVALPDRPRASETTALVQEVQREVGAAAGGVDLGPVYRRERSRPTRFVAEHTSPGGDVVSLILECNWHRLLVMGHGSTLELRLANAGAQPCTALRVELRSRALAEVVEWSHLGLKPGQSVDALLEVDVLKSGVSVLQVSVSYETPLERVRLAGRTSMTVHVAPSESNITVSVGNIFSELQDGAGTGAELNIETLVDIGKIKTVNDLIAIVLPDRFVRIPLELEGFGGGAWRNMPGTNPVMWQKIPARYASYVKKASRMELVPVRDACSDGGEEPSILLVAGETFRLGRQRGEVDYLAWFWPRNLQNDERTMRLSKGAHLSLRLSGSLIYIEDSHSENGSTFRGMRVPRPCETGSDLAGLPSGADGGRLRLDGRGVVVLAGEYELELIPLPRGPGSPPSIVNESAWPGSDGDPVGELPFGCVRLDPVNSAVALQRSVWILSDLSFGKAQTNGLVFADGQTPEVQGRFIYHRSQFWIETVAESNGVQVDGTAILPGELIPLVERQIVRIGGLEYRTNFPEPVRER